MKKIRFSGNVTAQVIFPDVDGAVTLSAGEQSAAAAKDTVLLLSAPDADAWIAVNSDPAPAADADGNMFIPAGLVVPVAVSAGGKICATAKLNVVPSI